MEKFMRNPAGIPAACWILAAAACLAFSASDVVNAQTVVDPATIHVSSAARAQRIGIGDRGKTIVIQADRDLQVGLPEIPGRQWEFTSNTGAVLGQPVVVHKPNKFHEGPDLFIATFTPELTGKSVLVFTMKDNSGKVLDTFTVTVLLPHSKKLDD
jgi:hypothetical protein